MRLTSGRVVVGVFLVCDIAPLVYAATQSWFWQQHSVAPTTASIELIVVSALIFGRYRWAWVLLTVLFGLEVVGWPLTVDRFHTSRLLYEASNTVAFAALLSPQMRQRLRRPIGLRRTQSA